MSRVRTAKNARAQYWVTANPRGGGAGCGNAPAILVHLHFIAPHHELRGEAASAKAQRAVALIRFRFHNILHREWRRDEPGQRIRGELCARRNDRCGGSCLLLPLPRRRFLRLAFRTCVFILAALLVHLRVSRRARRRGARRFAPTRCLVLVIVRSRSRSRSSASARARAIIALCEPPSQLSNGILRLDAAIIDTK